MSPTEEVSTSVEEQFFGVSTVIDTSEKKPEINIEIVDDRPPEDQRPAKSADDDVKQDDDDLKDHSKKVQKRINKLKYEQHEQRRRAEAAERVRDEAINVTRGLLDRTRQYEEIINSGEARLVQQIKTAAERAVESSRAANKQAIEEGDTDAIIKAQEALIVAQSENREAWRYAADYEQRSNNYRQQQQFQAQMPRPQRPQQPQQPVIPKPSAEASEWAKDNPWFGNDEHKDMTALAYGVHEDLVMNKGFKPNSDEYFEEINSTMRKRFPEYFDEPKKSTTVVAAAMRNNGARPRKVKLTSSQVALAERLGISLEDYANELMKGAEHG